MSMPTPGDHDAMEKPLFDEQFLRRLEKFSFLVNKAMLGGLAGEHRSVHKGFSSDFADYRAYTHGDDFRRIDWSIYGRLERIVVKLTEAKESLTVHLLLDCSRSMDWGDPNKLRYAKRVAAALGYIALARADAVTVSCLGDGLYQQMPLQRGKLQLLRFLRFLEHAAAAGRTDLEASSIAFLDRQRQPGLVVLISDLLSPGGYEAPLKHLLSRNHDLLVVHLLAPTESTPDFSGDLTLVDSETGQSVEVTINDDLLRQYTARLQEWTEEIERFCERRGITYLQIDTSWPLESSLLTYLHQRRVIQ